jgi:succinate dehydrogenase flavin-adding protein (antitoxin of CptAB toxin-antitoxin module)
MKELDRVLTHYLENHYEDSSQNEKKAFSLLLDNEDPELFAMIMWDSKPECLNQAAVLLKLREGIRSLLIPESVDCYGFKNSRLR